jgi:hypothetical protein
MWILTFLGFGTACAVWVLFIQRRAHNLRSADWDALLAGIQPMHMRGLELVALDHLTPERRQLKLEPAEIWGLVGGTEGLRRMEHNADLIIALAAYVRRWNYEESVIVAERIRHDAVQMKRALRRIRWAGFVTRSQIRVPFYIHQAAAAYYLMTKRLLNLYEANQYLLYPRLAEAL